jgi:7-keto-8-aminopelargonate synthetase-like enzyme
MPNIPSDFCTATTIRRGETEFISFGGCNYLGLAHRPEVIKAVIEATGVYGLSSSASRETTGNARPHALLETRLTAFCGHRRGLLVPDGYTANLAAMQGLEALGISHALIDARAHASLKDAATLAGMEIRLFDHLDAEQAHSMRRDLDAPCVILTDSVFTTDGELAPVHALHQALGPSDWLLLDDCHGFGVLGDHGRGTPNELGLRSDRLIVTTTLAKGLGCAGGIVMGPEEPIESARVHSIAYRCTTPAAPPLVAAGLVSLRLLEHDETLHQRLHANIDHVRTTLRSLDLPAHSLSTPIFAFTIDDRATMKQIEQTLLDAGIILPLMDYPNGPAPIYFRLSVNASHTIDQLNKLRGELANAIASAVAEANI